MRSTSACALSLGVMLALALLPALASTETGAGALLARPSSVDAQVWQVLRSAEQAEVLVVLRRQADLAAATTLSSRVARGRYVYDTLRSLAREAQQDLRAFLEGQGIAYRPLYIVNAVYLRADESLLRALATRPDVDRIVLNPWLPGIPLSEPASGALLPAAPSTGIEPNLVRVNADDVWALGYSGEGVVVAGQDTGYDAEHPALQAQYRGWDGATFQHDYNWHDAIHGDAPGTIPGNPCGFDAPQPCDDHGHGTHTMGTMVGDDGAGHQVGVAPGARWLGCRNMEQGVGSPATYLECFEFFLAPYPVGGTPAQGNPDLAPHVVNNSWSCPPGEGCDLAILEAAVSALRQAGIAVVVSAGNYGSACATVRYPPAIYPQALSVAAFDHRTNQIASFSSRGPVTYGGQTFTKPEIAAPGVSINSSFPGGIYGRLSGTSMAAPHVAGGVALLLSAAPRLAGDVDAVEQVLTSAAEPRVTSQGCGCDGPDDLPNNVWGWGSLDLLAAVSQATSGTLQGRVTRAGNGAPVPDARLTVHLPGWPEVGDETSADALGHYSLALPAGSYQLEAAAPCYAPHLVPSVEVLSDTVTIHDVVLVPGLCSYLPLVVRH